MNKAKKIEQEFFRRKRLFRHKPADKKELFLWTKVHFGLDLTQDHVCPNHHSQIDWLWHSANEMGDSYVLACRNGGKTSLGAVATVYDATYRPPTSTIIVGGCLHPQTPVLTARGFKKICEIEIGDEVFDGKVWRHVIGKGSRPASPYLKISFIGLPPLYLTHEHQIIRAKGIDCPLAPDKPMLSPRVCSPDVNCPYHRRRFKCKGRGGIEEVEARCLQAGDALIYPLRYSGRKPTTSPSPSPFLQGILYGSVKRLKNGFLEIIKPYSQSREYDRYVLDQIREAIGRELGALPLEQKSSGKAFVLVYDSGFFQKFPLGDSLPTDFFNWSQADQWKFTAGILNGSRFVLYNCSSDIKAFSSRRDTNFALNLFALLAHARPRLETDPIFDMRLTLASTSVETIKKLVPPRLCVSEASRHRAATQPLVRFFEWGKSLCMRIKSIEECPPSEPFCDLEIEGGERFLTLCGLVHNSKRQSERMYSYTKPIFLAGSRGILQDQVEIVGRELTRLKNGSTIEILASTELSVGGFHQDRIRIDQVDDMKPKVWNTLQFDVNQASEGKVQVETFGTWDRVGGLYEKVLQNAIKRDKPLFQW